MGSARGYNIEIFRSQTTRNDNKDFFIDDKFEPYKVGHVKVRPSLKPDVLTGIMDNYDAVVLESFGCGNISKRLIDGSVRDYVEKGNFIINCSQPRSIVNISSGYSLGREFIEAGKKDGDDTPLHVITAGDWTPSYSEIRMAYILGHRDDISSVALKEGLDTSHLIHAVFIAGTKFIDEKSRDSYKKITGITPYPKNILHYNDFNSVLEKIASYQWEQWE